MATTTTISQGIAIYFKNQPWLVTYAQFVNPGKGAAFTRVKLKNLKTDQAIENTFKSGETVELVDVLRKRCQYLYNDGTDYFFMDNESYDQFSLNKEALGNATNFLIDGAECYALLIDGNPISVQLPPKMPFKVIATTPGVKGDTATGGSKECTIETGATVKVPLFIKEDDVIIVNTENGDYTGKG